MKIFGVTFDDFGGDGQHGSSDSLVCSLCNSDFEILTALQTYYRSCSLYPKTSSCLCKFPTFSGG